ncbi:MAG: hypothetical protein ABIF71_05045, partial [Planctomycetota bacterium]
TPDLSIDTAPPRALAADGISMSKWILYSFTGTYHAPCSQVFVAAGLVPASGWATAFRQAQGRSYGVKRAHRKITDFLRVHQLSKRQFLIL